MFCTSKERETCDVEKMTCDGCYYNKDGDYMNEEDILKRAEEVMQDWEQDDDLIQGLLDLYNQEKEKNKKLEEERQHLMDGYLKQAEIKMKIIDMIAGDYINNHIGGEYSDTPCEYYEKIEKKEKCQGKMWDDVSFGECKECLIDYYFKKARGEEDE